MLLESAKDDRLDVRLEVAELQQDPTASLIAVRRKRQSSQPLTRSEWVLLGQYIRVATEDLKQNAVTPPASSFVAILRAFLAVRGLHTERGSGLDRYYLENLGVPQGGGLNERQMDPQLVLQTVAEIAESLERKPQRHEAIDGW